MFEKRTAGGEGPLITEKGGSGGEREREKKSSAQQIAQEKLFPQNHRLGKGEGLITASYYKWWIAKSEVLKGLAITMILPGRLSRIPVGKEDRETWEWAVWSEDPLENGEIVLFLECIW